jgi:hypothetical protein
MECYPISELRQPELPDCSILYRDADHMPGNPRLRRDFRFFPSGLFASAGLTVVDRRVSISVSLVVLSLVQL